MKKIGKVISVVALAVMLALCALCFTACNEEEQPAPAKQQYTLTFMVGTSLYKTVTAEEGSAYEAVPDPVRVNYVFDGWSTSPNGAVEQLPATMPAENRTYYAIFSARFTLTLNAGIGTLPSGTSGTMSVKEGEGLYEILSSINPTSGGDATFAGWFLRGSEQITATSGQKMPGSNVEVVAKYSVGYTIDIFKESAYNTGNYGDRSEVKSGTAYVGEKITGFPSYSGYYYDDNKENAVLSANLDKNSANNKYSLYYKIIGYNTVFNVNLPSDVEYEGTMDTMTCGYNTPYETPDCKYTADGYRFQGWATTPDGAVQYRPGENFTVQGVTTFYAQWVKGMTELAGLSSDRVYIMDEKESGGIVKVAYLERFGLDDIRGDYNATTGVFTFKNANATDPNAVLLRGIVNFAQNTFTYFNTVSATRYTLRTIDGEVNPNVTMTVREDGTAQYIDGTNTYNGNYTSGADGSLHFKAESKEFAFRITHSSDTNTFANFMIRGTEYGEWNNIDQAGNVDLSYTLKLDGYGSAVMAVSGLDNSLTERVTNDFGGIYFYNTGDDAYTGNLGLEVVVILYNSSLQYRAFACLLMKGEYHTATDADTAYSNVYLERFETTLYAAPAQDEELDKETADKIVLDGYSVVPNSATYTYKNNGTTVTVKGKYAYDRTVGTLRIIPTSGSDYLFEISMSSSEEDAVPLFEPVERLFGQYAIALDNVYGRYRFYTLHIYNNNVAAFAFRLPVQDDFYGNVVQEYTRIIFGRYEVVTPGVDGNGRPDEKANVYEYSATISPVIVSYINYLYGGLYGYPLNISQFASFRFQFVYSAQTDEIAYVTVTVAGDFQTGDTLTYNGKQYTLDGFGTAVSADGQSKLKYSYDSMLGLDRLVLYVDANDSTKYEIYLDARKDGTYVEYEGIYVVSNANDTFEMIIFKDNTALLTLDLESGMSITFYAFAFGNITWDSNRVYGRFVRDDSVSFGDIYFAIGKTYSDFTFKMVTTTKEDGKTSTYIYIYEVNESAVNQNGEFVIVKSNGDELTINRNTAKAKYFKKGTGEAGDKMYSGDYFYADGTLWLYHLETPDSTSYTVITFRFVYGSNGSITSFEVIGAEAGYYLSADDSKSYIYLTGAASTEPNASSDKVAIYYEYNTDYDPDVNNASEKYTEYVGTYKVGTNGYDFTYKTGETDENGDPETATFTFATGTDRAGLPVFKKYVMKLSTYVYIFTASYGRPVAVGSLTGGGYDDQVFTYFNTAYKGNMEWSAEGLVWVFTATNGSKFYFRMMESVGPILLDNSYVLESRGMFTLSETIDVEVDAYEGSAGTDNTPAVDPIPAHTAHVTSIEMTGMAFAYLHYMYNETEMVISGIYLQYANNGYAFLLIGEEELTVLFRFRLMRYNGEDEEGYRYVAELADMDHFGTYVGDDLTAINLNGFNFAFFIDGYGRVFTGSYTIIDEENNILEIVYIDTVEYTVKYVYVMVDSENGTYVTLSPDDPRIPDASDPDTSDPDNT